MDNHQSKLQMLSDKKKSNKAKLEVHKALHDSIATILNEFMNPTNLNTIPTQFALVISPLYQFFINIKGSIEAAQLLEEVLDRTYVHNIDANMLGELMNIMRH